MTLDINCDLGEGEAPSRTRALMRLIDSANIACGGHAGDLASMTRCIRLAKAFNVRLGAHPGAPDRAGFGRLATCPAPADLALWVVQQAGTLARLAELNHVPLHHIKLHGALYHASEAEDALARAYLDTVREYFPGTTLYCLSGGRVARLARRAGIAVKEELFADRAYAANGHLVPRNEVGAVLANTAQVGGRLAHWLATGRMATHEGGELRLRGETLCVHGDGEHAVALARAVRKIVGARPA